MSFLMWSKRERSRASTLRGSCVAIQQSNRDSRENTTAHLKGDDVFASELDVRHEISPVLCLDVEQINRFPREHVSSRLDDHERRVLVEYLERDGVVFVTWCERISSGRCSPTRATHRPSCGRSEL